MKQHISKHKLHHVTLALSNCIMSVMFKYFMKYVKSQKKFQIQMQYYNFFTMSSSDNSDKIHHNFI